MLNLYHYFRREMNGPSILRFFSYSLFNNPQRATKPSDFCPNFIVYQLHFSQENFTRG